MTLIDGYNLLWAFPELRELMVAGRSELAREGLLRLLARLIRSGRLSAPVTVVFDGSPAQGVPCGSVPGELEVRFAPHPSSADDLIREIVESSANAAGITVVSSDREVRSRAARAGASVIRTGEFVESRLPRRPRARGSERPEPPADKPAPPQGQAEVDRWLREFGLDG